MHFPEVNPKKYNEAYSFTLSRHKELIKKNIYAKELEVKYHKIRHHTFKAPKISQNKSFEEKPLWPIESSAFTEVLKSKLSSISGPKTSKSQQQKTYF